MQRAVATAVERFGGLDVVVANAGIASRARPSGDEREAFDRVLDVNLHGVHRTVEAALPEIARRRGHVVVVASIYAFINGMGAAPYAMAKAGVEQLGRLLRVELAQHGASASVAYFGFIDTELVHKGIDADPLADTMLERSRRRCASACSRRAAGEAIVLGIERRRPRIIRPRRWTALSLLRGITGPLEDAQAVRDAAPRTSCARSTPAVTRSSRPPREEARAVGAARVQSAAAASRSETGRRGPRAARPSLGHPQGDEIDQRIASHALTGATAPHGARTAGAVGTGRRAPCH
jgi:NAD(P)-dependent dehydrogenase (short-subunit alcohol dehydrogenase family)